MMNKALVFAVMTASLAGVAQAEYSVGATPSDFTCNTTRPDLHGTSWNLMANRGKVVMINFGAVWCGPCNSGVPVPPERL
jgi:thiol-disulfide isomerase/thioredoxin